MNRIDSELWRISRLTDRLNKMFGCDNTLLEFQLLWIHGPQLFLPGVWLVNCFQLSWYSLCRILLDIFDLFRLEWIRTSSHELKWNILMNWHELAWITMNRNDLQWFEMIRSDLIRYVLHCNESTWVATHWNALNRTKSNWTLEIVCVANNFKRLQSR